MADIKTILAGIIFAIAGGAVFFFGFKFMHKYRIIQDTPQSKIRSMAMGLVELHGKAKAKNILKSPFTKTDCVYYRYEVEEYRAHTSGSGSNRRTTHKWDTIYRGEKRIPFNTSDETGEVLTNPEGADFNLTVKKMFIQKSGLFGAFNIISNALKGFDENSSELDTTRWGLKELDPTVKFRVSMNRVGDRRYSEYYIGPEEDIFVLGTAANDSSAENNVIIKKGSNEPTYIISDRSEKELVKNLLWKTIGAFAIGGLFLIVGIIILLNTFGVI